MTLTSRRSGTGSAAGTAGACGTASRAAPQSPQNRLSAKFSLPQATHCHGSGVPQSPQNLLLVAAAAPQRGHIMPWSFCLSTTGKPLCACFQSIQFSGAPGGVKCLGGTRSTRTYQRYAAFDIILPGYKAEPV